MKKVTKFLFNLSLLFSLTVIMGCNSDEPGDPHWIDSEFAKILEERGYIKDAHTVTVSEVENLVAIDVSGINYSNRGKLKSMKGLEYFTNLEELRCHSNLLRDINVSNLNKLRVLECQENYLTSLDISSNKNLEQLECYTNEITSLNLTGLEKLKILDCSSNRFSSLDVTNQEELTNLTCSGLHLTSLDVSKNTKLKDLRCHGNELEEIDIYNCRSLGMLDCRWNPGKNGIFTVYAWFSNNNVPIAIAFDGTYNGVANAVKLNIVEK